MYLFTILILVVVAAAAPTGLPPQHGLSGPQKRMPIPMPLLRLPADQDFI